MLCSTDENPLKITNIEKYKIIESLKSIYSIERLCNLLQISSRAYRKWKSCGKPIANNFSKAIAYIISKEHRELKGVYGVLRMKYHIFRKYKLCLNHKLIRRYKKILNIVTSVRKLKYTSRRQQIKNMKSYMASNLINNDFSSNNPLTKLSTDITIINCKDGRLYLSAVKDLCTNEIIAYGFSSKNDTQLVINTFNKLNLNNSIVHSDQGSQYYSWEYRELLKQKNALRSMSARGCCWQNSPIENWFSQLKQEEIQFHKSDNRQSMIKRVKKYVQWYNTERIQKNLNYLTPIEYRKSLLFI